MPAFAFARWLRRRFPARILPSPDKTALRREVEPLEDRCPAGSLMDVFGPPVPLPGASEPTSWLAAPPEGSGAAATAGWGALETDTVDGRRTAPRLDDPGQPRAVTITDRVEPPVHGGLDDDLWPVSLVGSSAGIEFVGIPPAAGTSAGTQSMDLTAAATGPATP